MIWGERLEKKRNLAIIPARSGSKGLKDKNIRDLCGKPMMAYSIEAALKSGIFHTIMVSTDNEIYAKIAREYGADVPFLRSEDLSSDTANSWDVAREVIKKYEENGLYFDRIVLLQPTSPLRNDQDIIGAISFHEKKGSMTVSVCECDHSPLWAGLLPEDYKMDKFIDKQYLQPRQKLEKYYRINGALYIIEKDYLYKQKNENLYQDCYAYIMPKKRSVDIDSLDDFKYAEYLITKYKFF